MHARSRAFRWVNNSPLAVGSEVMKEATMVLGAAAFIRAVCYLVSMARLASLLRTEVHLEGVGIDGANAQMKLLGVVFLRRNLDSDFASRHRMLLTLAR